MNPYASLFPQLDEMGLTAWSKQLQDLIPKKLATDGSHGKMEQWQKALDALPQVIPTQIELKSKVEIGSAADLNDEDKPAFIENLKAFHPWRKGPYNLLGVEIDTEWRSDWKWERVLPHIQPLAGRKVLDIGGGNGYPGWRMLGEGAELVIGIDPTPLFLLHFQNLK